MESAGDHHAAGIFGADPDPLDRHLRHLRPARCANWPAHLAVAAAIKNSDADCGIGVYSAAKIMDLDFIPIGDEHYDIVLPSEYLELDSFKEFFEIIKSDEYKKKLIEIGGYEFHNLGETVKL